LGRFDVWWGGLFFIHSAFMRHPYMVERAEHLFGGTPTFWPEKMKKKCILFVYLHIYL
jgi:hypothetical protein